MDTLLIYIAISPAKHSMLRMLLRMAFIHGRNDFHIRIGEKPLLNALRWLVMMVGSFTDRRGRQLAHPVPAKRNDQGTETERAKGSE